MHTLPSQDGRATKRKTLETTYKILTAIFFVGINMKNFLILLLLVSCSGVQLKSEPNEIKPELLEVKSVQTIEMPKVLKLKSLTGFNDKNKAEFLKAESKANEIIYSQCFSEFMLNRKLIQTNGLSNLELVNKIRTTVTEIDLISYSSWRSVVGYTMPSAKWVKVNSKFYNGSSVCAKASNLAHENSHKQGFGHASKPNKERPYSVPYSINAAMELCCGK
jgi:hypothetical protein